MEQAQQGDLGGLIDADAAAADAADADAPTGGDLHGFGVQQPLDHGAAGEMGAFGLHAAGHPGPAGTVQPSAADLPRLQAAGHVYLAALQAAVQLQRAGAVDPAVGPETALAPGGAGAAQLLAGDVAGNTTAAAAQSTSPWTLALPEQRRLSQRRLPWTLPDPLMETVRYSPPGMALLPEIFISMMSFIM